MDSLPLAKPLQRAAEGEEAHLDYLINKNNLGSLMKSKVMTRAFLGYNREAKIEESVVLEAQGDSVAKPKWDQALPADVHAILEEFDDVFPKELPQGYPQCARGMSSKLNWKITNPLQTDHYTK